MIFLLGIFSSFFKCVRYFRQLQLDGIDASSLFLSKPVISSRSHTFCSLTNTDCIKSRVYSVRHHTFWNSTTLVVWR